MQNDAHNFLSFRAFVRIQRSVEILDERCVIVLLKLPVATLSYYSTCTTPLCSVFVLRTPAHSHWSLQCDRCKSINIEVSISISIFLRQSVDIGIDDTFKAGIDIEYRRYFWKISITTLLFIFGLFIITQPHCNHFHYTKLNTSQRLSHSL